MLYEAIVRVITANGRIKGRILNAKTPEGLQRKIDKLYEQGTLYAVEGRREMAN